MDACDRESAWRQDEWYVLVSPRGWLILACSMCGFRYWLHRDSGANRLEISQMVSHRDFCNV